jgi:hypothetical protein
VESDGGSVRCSTVNILFGKEEIENLQFSNLLRKFILEKVAIGNGNSLKREEAITCNLLVNVNKNYSNSLLNDDGSVSGKNAKYYVNYTLNEREKIIKKSAFSIFYNANISRHQYSNKVLLEKEERNVAEKISQKIFWGIKRYL